MDENVVQPVLPPVRGPFRAIGSVVLPSPDALDDEGWARAESIVERALTSRPPSVRRQVRLFLRMVNLLPILRTGRTLVGLPLDGRARVLERIQYSRLLLLRRGLWGIRTLLFMGYYTQDSVRHRIGYRATAGGWVARADVHGGPADRTGPVDDPPHRTDAGGDPPADGDPSLSEVKP